ncbi:MAG: alpha-amylase family glycosyl hydrolase [Bacteroidia bacterium]|nr:alpha-amylase family glycosyl hydrolase [Bacteroidia bacterium]
MEKLRLPGLYLFMVLAIGCDKQSPPIEPEPKEDPQSSQYGTPFAKIPAIADVVLYEVNPRVYSSAKNLDGITARLDSIRALGVNVVWIMPIYQTGSVKSVGSPYAIKDYFSIHSDYGNLEDLRELVDKAHSLDMAVMMDWVANHTAWDNPWINNSGWYQTDANGNIIIPPGTNWQDVAELNYDNQEMRQEMIKAMKYWVLEANVDGYRCDFASGVPGDFWRQALDTLRSVKDREILMFAESDQKWLLDSGFDMIFGWNFYGRLKSIYNENKSASEVYAAHVSEYSGLDADEHIVRWITNHDENAWDATPQYNFKSLDGAFGAFAIASYLGGVPLIYNGQEVGEPQRLPFFEGNNTQINWLLNPDYKQKYKTLMRFRAGSEAVRYGAIANHHTFDVAGFRKIKGNEDVYVIVNVRNKQVDYPIPTSLEGTVWRNIFDSGQTKTLSGQISLAPFECQILAR